jgi:hypothetical protein
MHVDVGNPNLDDLGNYLVRLLVVSYAHLGGVVTRLHWARDTWRQRLISDMLRQLVKLVNLAAVLILNGHTVSLTFLVVLMSLLDHFVQELIELPVLTLAHVAPETEAVDPIPILREYALGEDGKAKWLVVMLIDESAQLGLNLEVDASALDLVEVLIANNKAEQEVGDSP